MRNRLRLLAFDVLAPVAAVAALLYIGVALGWPLWWVSVCSVLCVLVAEGVVVNFVLARRDAVTVGTDDDGPGLRLAVVGATTAALVAAGPDAADANAEIVLAGHCTRRGVHLVPILQGLS